MDSFALFLMANIIVLWLVVLALKLDRIHSAIVEQTALLREDDQGEDDDTEVRVTSIRKP